MSLHLFRRMAAAMRALVASVAEHLRSRAASVITVFCWGVSRTDQRSVLWLVLVWRCW